MPFACAEGLCAYRCHSHYGMVIVTLFICLTLDQQAEAHWLTIYVCKSNFHGRQSCSLVQVSSMAASMIQRKTRGVATETVRPAG